MRRPDARPLNFILSVGCALALFGCAALRNTPTSPAAPAMASAASAAAAASAASAARAGAPPAASQPQPFDTVIKDAKKIDGLFALWQKDDKVWIELKPDDFGKPFFLAPKIARGIGEHGLFGGTMIGRYGRWGRPQIVEWKRVYNQVQLLARNTDFVAADNTPEGRAVQAGFSPSLVGSTAVASLPHPERKTVLIEANPLFMADVLGLGMALQQAYRQGYAMDARNSSFSMVRGKPDAVFFEVSAHFATASINLPTPGAAG